MTETPKGIFKQMSSLLKSKGRDRTFQSYTRNRSSAGLGHDFNQEDTNICVTASRTAKNVKDTPACSFWSPPSFFFFSASPIITILKHYSIFKHSVKGIGHKMGTKRRSETTIKGINHSSCLYLRQLNTSKAVNCSRGINSIWEIQLSEQAVLDKFSSFWFWASEWNPDSGHLPHPRILRGDLGGLSCPPFGQEGKQTSPEGLLHKQGEVLQIPMAAGLGIKENNQWLSPESGNVVVKKRTQKSPQWTALKAQVSPAIHCSGITSQPALV